MIYHYGERYEKLGKCARESFKKFHPDIPLHHVDDVKESEFTCALNPPECKGIFKYMLAHEIMIRHSYDKMIILGGDTITCGRLDEFLNNDEDILTTLNIPVSELHPFYSLVEEEIIIAQTRCESINHKKEYYSYNADVVCFNNPAALKAVIESGLQHRKVLSDYEMRKHTEAVLENVFKKPVFVGPIFFYEEFRRFVQEHGQYPQSQWSRMIVLDYYAEQAGLNIVASISESNKKKEQTLCGFNFTVKCVDDPHGEDNVVYNIRSKGDVIPQRALIDSSGGFSHDKPWEPYIKEFYVKDDKLYTGKHKQIKVWHYGEGFGNLSNDEFEDLLDLWINKWFNQETKDFFTDECNCGDFFAERGLK